MIVFYLFAVVLVFLSYKSFRGGIDYLEFFKRELAKPKSDYTPPVSIVVPCRGPDQGLEENLSALFRQDFPHYEILFVVGDPADEAVPVIERLREKFRGGDAGTRRFSKIIFAGQAETESQKVHNLRQAVLQASAESEVYVFVDSDARPGPDWLLNLIEPLRDESLGAATAYRWFVSKKGNFGSEMRAVWNASIASALGANVRSNFCWGGSMALRRKTFENLGMLGRWRGTLSDDFAVTRAVRQAGLGIYFVPRALAASVEDCTLGEALEFTTRQMKITRVYAPHLWKQSLVGAFLFNLVFIWGILLIALGSVRDFSFWFALASLILISVFSVGKSLLRLEAVRLVLRDYPKELKRQSWTQNTLWVLSPLMFLYNGVCALLSRKILWRGIRYELKSPTETVIMKANGE